MGIGTLGLCMHLSWLIWKMSSVGILSQEVLDTWRARDVFMRKFRRSCRRLDVSIASCYVVVKTTVLVLFGVIIQATITVLIS